MPFGDADIFLAEPLQPENKGWGDTKGWLDIKPDCADDTDKKRLYGIELTKIGTEYLNEFDAAFGLVENNTVALWISRNWVTDPVVIAARDAYLDAVEAEASLLDKQQLAARILKISTEKTESGKYLVTAKERIEALRLYADVMGFNKSAQNNLPTLLHNEIRITLVDPVKEELKTIDVAPNSQNSNDLPNSDVLKVKLVG